MTHKLYAAFGMVLTLGLCACAGWQAAQGPVVPVNGVQENGVLLVEQKPADACQFKGGILGATNPDTSGIPVSLMEVNAEIRQGLASSARHMGGNTVWLRTQSWQNPDISTDYYQPFYMNDVEYTALVYACPAAQ